MSAIATSRLIGGELEVHGWSSDPGAPASQIVLELDLIDETSPAWDHEIVAEWNRGDCEHRIPRVECRLASHPETR